LLDHNQTREKIARFDVVLRIVAMQPKKFPNFSQPLHGWRLPQSHLCDL